MRQDLDTWLNQVDYSYLNSSNYVPSEFALTFMNFIKLVNGSTGESNKTPPFHLSMLDKLVGGKHYTANLCFRGAGKTALMIEYMSLYLGIFGHIHGFGSVDTLIYVSDSMDNGVKTARKNIEFKYNSSDFLQEWIPKATFTDNYIEFMSKENKRFGMKMFGAKALALDTKLHTPNGYSTIGSCKVGDTIIGADGKPCSIVAKSKVFHKPMYAIRLSDKRVLKVSEDHLNQVFVRESSGLNEYTLTTEELLELPLVYFSGEQLRHNLWIEAPSSINYPRRDFEEKNLFSFGSSLVSRPDDSYLFGSIQQRLELLRGILATKYKVDSQGKIYLKLEDIGLTLFVCSLVRSLGGITLCKKTKARNWLIELRIKHSVVTELENKPYRFDRILTAIDSICRIPDEPSQCIAVDNKDKQFIAGEYIRTHNTGLRGTKIFGKRPVMAVLDDLVGDDDANSVASMNAIKDTIYKGVNHALDPTRRKVILSGTPFNKSDILVEAIESGAWDVNVWPVCQQFPCSKEDFQGAWSDRFTYDYLCSQYDLAEKTGKLAAFYQELMLRLSSEEERLIYDEDIRWYSRPKLINNRGIYNFYITTDFATSEKKRADNSVISVWAYNANGDWFWVDGICARQTMDKNINDLFRLVQEYRPQQVGVEVTGQQGAFISWLRSEMQERNIWFNFASSEKNNSPGIKPITSKLARFNIVVPWFKAGKMYFPQEMKQSGVMQQFMQELRLATVSGLKGKDDCLDTISMLGFFTPWKPSDSSSMIEEDGVWSEESADVSFNAFDSYVV